jgi:serine/threonine protein kinase
MSPESMERQTFNTETDIWSYGVLVWELFSRGMAPYSNVDNNFLFYYLENGNRLPKHQSCPISIYDILLKCWSKNPKSRPSFATLSERMECIIDNLPDDQNKTYLNINAY